jgi:hypothetical protein
MLYQCGFTGVFHTIAESQLGVVGGMYSVESWVAQNSASSASLLNLGIFSLTLVAGIIYF